MLLRLHPHDEHQYQYKLHVDNISAAQEHTGLYR